MSDPYNSNGLPDPPRADPANAAPARPALARARSVQRARRAEAPLGEVFERGLVAWNALALAAIFALLIFGVVRGGLGSFFFFGWPFLLALAIRFWVPNSPVCLIARGLTALWSLPLLLQFLRYVEAGIAPSKTLFLLTMVILLTLNAIFLKPAEPLD